MIYKDTLAFYSFSEINDPNISKNRDFKDAENDLLKLLYIFEKYELLFVEEIRLNRQIGFASLFLGERNSLSPTEKIAELQEVFKIEKFSNVLRLTGKTKIYLSKGDGKFYSSALSCYFSIKYFFIEINIMSDCWLPTNLEGKFQFEIGNLNSIRLENCLKEINSEFNNCHFFSSKGDEGEGVLSNWVIPDESFKIYLSEDITKREDFPKNKIDEVRKFIWKNKKDL